MELLKNEDVVWSPVDIARLFGISLSFILTLRVKGGESTVSSGVRRGLSRAVSIRGLFRHA